MTGDDWRDKLIDHPQSYGPTFRPITDFLDRKFLTDFLIKNIDIMAEKIRFPAAQYEHLVQYETHRNALIMVLDEVNKGTFDIK